MEARPSTDQGRMPIKKHHTRPVSAIEHLALELQTRPYHADSAASVTTMICNRARSNRPITMSISIAELEYCKASVQQGIRLDGRDLTDFRPVDIEMGLIAQANGSARLHLGSTDVLVGVKVEVGTPDASKPDCGRVQVTVECSACASPEYEVI